MIVKTYLSIGYPTAMQTEEIEIDDDDLEGLSSEERDNLIDEEVRRWADEHIEYWYEEQK